MSFACQYVNDLFNKSPIKYSCVNLVNCHFLIMNGKSCSFLQWQLKSWFENSTLQKAMLSPLSLQKHNCTQYVLSSMCLIHNWTIEESSLSPVSTRPFAMYMYSASSLIVLCFSLFSSTSFSRIFVWKIRAYKEEIPRTSLCEGYTILYVLSRAKIHR